MSEFTGIPCFIIDNLSRFYSASAAGSTVGEAPDDGEREEEDHVLGHLPRHRHHVCGVVALRSHRQDRGRDQTRSARRSLEL